MKTKKLTLISMLTACALIIFILEAQLPPLFPIPGIKLGLANTVTLFAICTLGRKEAFAVLMLRIVLGSIFTGNLMSLAFSACGGIAAYIVMAAALKLRIKIPLASILGAAAHNIGQLAAAAAITHTASVFYYLPPLLASAAATGLFTGIIAMLAVKRINSDKGN